MNRSEIQTWLDEMGIKKYTINPDLSVDVDGDVYINHMDLTSIPFQFGKVGGDFWCSNNNLTSLENCPKYVGVRFWCDNNQLTSLEHCPDYVGSDFWCYDNNITYIDHLPKYMGGWISFDDACMSEPIQLLIIQRYSSGISKILNPTDNAKQLHNMLWVL